MSEEVGSAKETGATGSLDLMPLPSSTSLDQVHPEPALWKRPSPSMNSALTQHNVGDSLAVAQAEAGPALNQQPRPANGSSGSVLSTSIMHGTASIFPMPAPYVSGMQDSGASSPMTDLSDEGTIAIDL
jgi:hypothetical protein